MIRYIYIQIDRILSIKIKNPDEYMYIEIIGTLPKVHVSNGYHKGFKKVTCQSPLMVNSPKMPVTFKAFKFAD